MRLIQRLASGMCEKRIEELREKRTTVSQATRTRPWKKLPHRVRKLMLRACLLKDELEAIEAQVQRKGYAFSTYDLRKQVRNQEPVTYKDAEKRERAARDAVDRRIAAIHRLKEATLRETLGMDEKAGKKYLDRLEKELQKV